MKKVFLSLFALLAVLNVAAQKVSEAEALQKAQSFLAAKISKARQNKSKTFAGAKSGATTLRRANSDSEYYVYNVGSNNGFIIVSADERTTIDILGYTDKGSFSMTDAPEALQYMLRNYALQIQSLQESTEPIALESSRATNTVSPIEPLIQTLWDQDAPYNLLTPICNGSHAATGCTCTAVAQILHYHQVPSCTALPAYVSGNINMPELEATTFDHSIMRNTYNGADTDAGAMECAKLMLYCGQAMQSIYGGSTGTNVMNLAPALTNNFGMSSDVERVWREFYTSSQWNAIIYRELAESRPVIYDGRNMNGENGAGHTFVCDGCDEDGLFHINWGWGGGSNGYFTLEDLTPAAQGTGGSTGGYNIGQSAFINIMPGENKGPRAYITAISQCSTSAQRNSAAENFKVNVGWTWYNMNPTPTAYTYGWALCNDEGKILLPPVQSQTTPDLNQGQGYKTTRDVLIPSAGVTSGTYRLVFATKTAQYDEWQPVENSRALYVKVVIVDNILVAAVVSNYGGEEDLTISSMTHAGGKERIGATVRYELAVTNNGTSTTTPILVYVDDDKYPVASTAANIDPKTSGTVNIYLQFTEPGTHTITLTNTDKENPVVYLRKEVTISDVESYTMSSRATFTPAIASHEDIVESDDLSVEYTLRNNGQNTYDDQVMLSLCRVISYLPDGRFSYQYTHPVYKDALIASGETKTYTASWANELEENQLYVIVCGYFGRDSNGNIGWQRGYSKLFYWKKPAEGMRGDANGDGVVSVTDIVATANHILGNTPEGFNADNADSNLDKTITVTDIVYDAQYILTGQFPE